MLSLLPTPSTTAILASIGEASTPVWNDLSPYAYIIIGIGVVISILGLIVGLLFGRHTH